MVARPGSALRVGWGLAPGYSESLAVYSGVKMHKQYLYGTAFTVMTDHS